MSGKLWFFFFNDTATTEIYTLSLHDALPIRRYGFDAAILFSDILVVPDALGQSVSFLEGEGPRLEPIRTPSDLGRLRVGATRRKFDRVFETVTRLRQDLPGDTSLI